MERQITTLFLRDLLSLYNNEDFYTHFPDPRVLSITATVAVLDLYAVRLCGLPRTTPEMHAKIEAVIEAFRKQWLRADPSGSLAALPGLLLQDDASKTAHYQCVTRCITAFRLNKYTPLT